MTEKQFKQLIECVKELGRQFSELERKVLALQRRLEGPEDDE